MTLEQESRPPHLNLFQLQGAAIAEAWDIVDQVLTTQAGDKEFEHWARSEGMADGRDNLRDLAAGILEKSPDDLDEITAKRLQRMVKTDPGRYVRFRAACALAAHDIWGDKVLTLLHEIAFDPNEEYEDVIETARKYLGKSSA